MYNFDPLNKFSNKLGSNISKPLNKHMKQLSKPIKSLNKIISKNLNKLPFKISPLVLFVLLLVLLLVICVFFPRASVIEGNTTGTKDCNAGSAAAVNKDRFQKFKDDYGIINPVNYSNNGMKDKLKNYYIFSSLNSAAGPKYDARGTDECMSTANLRDVLEMGARLVDFEIFHSNTQGLLFKAGRGPNKKGKYNTSSGTSNSLRPSQVFPELLKAVSMGNKFHTDPLIVNFRIQMTNKDALIDTFSMLRRAVEIFLVERKNFEGKPVLLDTQYRWNGKGPTPQQKLFEKQFTIKRDEVVPKKVFDLAIERGFRNMVSGFTKDKEMIEKFEKEVIPEAMEQLKKQGHCFDKVKESEEKNNYKNMLCKNNFLGYLDTTIEYPVPPAVDGYIGPLTYEDKTYSTFNDVCPDFCIGSGKKKSENLEVVYRSVLDASLNELSGKIIFCLHIDNINVSPTVFKVNSVDNAFFKYVNILGGDTAILKSHSEYKDEMTRAKKTIPNISKSKLHFSMMKPNPNSSDATPNQDCFFMDPESTTEDKEFCEHKLGVQAIMMKFYSSDKSDPFKHYYKFFAKKGSAFVRKPSALRENPEKLGTIPDQNPKRSPDAKMPDIDFKNDNVAAYALPQKDTENVLVKQPNS